MNKTVEPIVFSTEAHPFVFPKNVPRKPWPCLLYRCPAKPSVPNAKTRLKQYWNAGLQDRDIDSYNELWYTNGLNRWIQSPTLSDTPEEVVTIPSKAFVMTSNFGIQLANNVTLSMWPDIQSPSYMVAQIEGKMIQREEQIVMVLRRKRGPSEVRQTFAKPACGGGWFHFSFGFGATPRPTKRCSLHKPLLTVSRLLQDDHEYFSFRQFRKMEPLPVLVRSLTEDLSGAMYRGIPVKNLRFGFLVDYVFDHVVSQR
jgi:hypothetical protein